jgi:hypothetical protein
VRATAAAVLSFYDRDLSQSGPHSVLFGIHKIASRQKRSIPTLRKSAKDGTHAIGKTAADG